MPQRHSCQNAVTVENPNIATEVTRMLTAVTVFVPKRFVRRSDIRLERIVPPEIIIETMPI